MANYFELFYKLIIVQNLDLLPVFKINRNLAAPSKISICHSAKFNLQCFAQDISTRPEGMS